MNNRNKKKKEIDADIFIFVVVNLIYIGIKVETPIKQCLLYFIGSLCNSLGGSGWVAYNGSCYQANDGNGDQGKSWRKARQQCQLFGGDLVSIHSQTEQTFVYQTLVYIKLCFISSPFFKKKKLHIYVIYIMF